VGKPPGEPMRTHHAHPDPQEHAEGRAARGQMGSTRAERSRERSSHGCRNVAERYELARSASEPSGSTAATSSVLTAPSEVTMADMVADIAVALYRSRDTWDSAPCSGGARASVPRGGAPHRRRRRARATPAHPASR
jgi:hypothetical protein